MDSLTRIGIARELIDIDSTTGREGEAGAFLARTLRALGYEVTEQPVSEGRFNVFARTGTVPPDVVFSTHFDCVPPFFPSRVSDGRLYGRGACDAKGIAVSQIAAAERLRAEGEPGVGLLFVVGEERGSDGARRANEIAPGSRNLVNGEPTENHLARATRGVYRARLSVQGVAAHTSQPHLGRSAIEGLVDVIVRLRALDWPADPELGETFYTVGLISGGVAPNVVPPHASCEVMFRTVGPPEPLRAVMEREFRGSVGIEDVLVVPPVALRTVSGFGTAVFSFTTDIPFLDRWGAPLLVGPGSVRVAHTADEHVAIADLDRAVDLYVSIARTLMSQSG